MASLSSKLFIALALIFTQTALAQRTGHVEDIFGPDFVGGDGPFPWGLFLLMVLIAAAIQTYVSKVSLKHPDHGWTEILLISIWWWPVSFMIVFYLIPMFI